MTVVRKAGRPPGSVSTPQTLLRSELRNTASTLASLRKLAEEQIKAIREALKNPNVVIGERLAVLETIAGVMDTLNKSMENGGKLLLNPRSADMVEREPKTEVDLDGLIGGGH